MPTKTYWPTIICETAIRQKLFEKEGIKAELTIYRSGAEGFEAIAAGAADLVLNSSSSVAAGLKKGVNARCVANGANGYYGWYLVVKTDFTDHTRSPSSPARRSASPPPVPAPISSPAGPSPSTSSTSRACRSAAAAWCRTC